MDALPIPEKIECSFKSTINGYSHACGHDFELAWGLLIAKYFAENPPENTLRLLFQPAEEEPGDEPLGRTGGQVYADTGVFDVDAIFSLHVDPEVELGTVSIIDGEVTCAAYDFEFILHDKLPLNFIKSTLWKSPVLSNSRRKYFRESVFAII